MSSWPFGIALGLIVQGRTAESLGWRMGMAIAALFCFFVLVLIFVVYRPPPGPAVRAAGGSTWWNPPARPSLRSVLIVGSAWAAPTSALSSCSALAPVFWPFVRKLTNRYSLANGTRSLNLQLSAVTVGIWRATHSNRRSVPCFISKLGAVAIKQAMV